MSELTCPCLALTGAGCRWSVRVPRVEPRRDGASGKTSYVYILHVVPVGESLGLGLEGPGVAAALDENQGPQSSLWFL